MLCVLNMFGVLLSAILLLTVTDVDSRYVRHPEIHRSIVNQKDIATWNEAKRHCEAEGAVLASPLDEEMLEYMRSSIGAHNHNTSYFIGISATGNPQLVYKSVEGVTLDDLPESVINMIDQLDPQDGDCLGMARQDIRVVSCRTQLPYMCYKNDTVTSTTVTPVDVTTDLEAEETTAADYSSLGYTYLSGTYYKLYPKAASWNIAQRICSEEGGYLVVINDANEARVVSDFASEIFNYGWGWMHIGLRRPEENGDWKSVLGNPLDQIYHRWQINFYVFHCGALDSIGNFNTVDCKWHLPYICEKK